MGLQVTRIVYACCLRSPPLRFRRSRNGLVKGPEMAEMLLLEDGACQLRKDVEKSWVTRESTLQSMQKATKSRDRISGDKGSGYSRIVLRPLILGSYIHVHTLTCTLPCISRTLSKQALQQELTPHARMPPPQQAQKYCMENVGAAPRSSPHHFHCFDTPYRY